MTAINEQFLAPLKPGEKLRAAPISAGLEAAREDIFRRFDDGEPAEKLIREMSGLVDHVLQYCFLNHIGDSKHCNCCLVAVGGYGRSELLPGSDIDLMILLEKSAGKDQQQRLSAFLTFLWDIGLEVGHSVRTIKDCVRQGKADITVMTNMIESRLIYGNTGLYEKYQAAISP
ncbi:MAG: DUF294 nucleotidyltransferase-like domain-containing protein, partial [Gammaproteobacteria bacterium]